MLSLAVLSLVLLFRFGYEFVYLKVNDSGMVVIPFFPIMIFSFLRSGGVVVSFLELGGGARGGCCIIKLNSYGSK